MADELVQRNGAVNTVLGPVPADQLGVTLMHEALLSVLPGAQYAPDISMDRAEIFATIAEQLRAFKAAGGGSVVDSTGMFHGRNVPLLESLSKATGVHIIASTGLGPEELLGGYFLTPQTNPPTPWPAEKFADLFAKEVAEGMVVPRIERRGAAGLVTATASRSGMTATDESLFRGSARAAASTGVPLSIRFGVDALAELDVVLSEGIAPERVLVGGLDRRDSASAATEIAARGAFVGIDSIGHNADAELLDDAARVQLVLALTDAGFGERIILSSNAIGVAKGVPASPVSFDHLLTNFVPTLRAAGISDDQLSQLLESNPRTLLSVD